MRRLLLLTSFAAVSGCTCHSTAANEVGVLTRKVAPFGTKGVQPEPYAPGATYVFPAFITDWDTFETKLQNLRMTKQPDADGVADDVEFKTVDGNDISVDVVVQWRIDPTKVGFLLQRVGNSTEDVQERLVRPTARAMVRDALNRLKSEDFYVTANKYQAADEARAKISESLNPEGVIIEQVVLGEHRFNPAYEEVIREKKLAEQTAEKLKSEAQAAGEAAKRNLEGARGKVNQKIATARGELEKTKLGADATLIQSRNEAEAIIAEAKARAQGIEKQNLAMAGTGGRTMVKLRIADALEGKRIVLVPGGKGANLQTLDVNQLISNVAASQVLRKP
jgi:regulator of protease activity HflC (stomatin/prohibitin superfamily)